MKKVAILAAVMLALLCASCALADGMGVQVIGGPTAGFEPVNLDDIKLSVETEIEGYAILYPKEFAFEDRYGYYRAGNKNIADRNDYTISGVEADFAILRMDIINLAQGNHDFLASCEVKVYFDDKYEYAGWFRQSNYNNSTDSHKDYGADAGAQNNRWVIDKADQFPIASMFQGHYVFGCKLPNAVVSSKSPLRMVIKLDENEITYHIRK